LEFRTREKEDIKAGKRFIREKKTREEEGEAVKEKEDG
jgi:hypothetical protein